MSLEQRLTDDMKSALKAGNTSRLSVLRMLRSEILLKKKEDASIQVLPDDQVVRAFAAYAKKLRTAADDLQGRGRAEDAEKLREEIRVVEEYLPSAMSPDEARGLVSAVIAELGATSIRDMGRVMKEVQVRSGGRADGKTLSDLVKAALA